MKTQENEKRFIAIPASILNDSERIKYVGYYMWMRENAIFSETYEIRIGENNVTLHKGEFTYSVRYLAKAWNISHPTVMKALREMERLRMIKTVCKFKGNNTNSQQNIYRIETKFTNVNDEKFTNVNDKNTNEEIKVEEIERIEEEFDDEEIIALIEGEKYEKEEKVEPTKEQMKKAMIELVKQINIMPTKERNTRNLNTIENIERHIKSRMPNMDDNVMKTTMQSIKW